MSDRAVALRVVGRVTEGGAYAERAFTAEAARAHLDSRGRGLAAWLAYGTIQRRRTIDHVCITVAGRDPAALDPLTRDVVRLGAFQLLFAAGIPAHAAVSTSVDLVREAGAGRATGLVNALLRRIAADGAAVLAALPEHSPDEAAVRYSYPDWIAGMWFAAYGPETARGLLAAGNEPAETALRISSLRPGAAGRVEAALAEVPHRQLEGAVVLDGPFDLAGSAIHRSGDVVAMSRASQRIVPFLEPEPGMRVLDACAAPGGKAGHLAALLGGGHGLVCVERNRRRAAELGRTLLRQGVEGVEVICDDARRLPAELGAFDAILVDAPCTGLGVVAGRADLRWRRQESDVAGLAAIQRELVTALLDRLQPGGRLVYAVCTLSPQENEGVVDGLPVGAELRTWPHLGDGDGFFAARITP
jgi:16S rRNA (cytosine967-C5)-methyltransferase